VILNMKINTIHILGFYILKSGLFVSLINM